MILMVNSVSGTVTLNVVMTPTTSVTTSTLERVSDDRPTAMVAKIVLLSTSFVLTPIR